MSQRFDLDTLDINVLRDRAASGTLNPPLQGCLLEISSSVWNQAEKGERAMCEEVFARMGVNYEVVSQIGAISWVCP